MNPILQSEGFERAASELRRSFDAFNAGRTAFDESVKTFAATVDKLARIAGMQAQNACNISQGLPPCYNEADFSNL